jgi:acetyl-CoA carboxylase biotin carboxyl carrier protein
MPAGSSEPRKISRARGRDASSTPEPETSAQANGVVVPAAGIGNLMLDLDFVRGLIDAVDGSSIDTLEINRAGTRIRISKTPTGNAAAHAGHASPPVELLAPPGGAPAVVETEAEAARRNFLEVTSPMVGTFYRAPAPEAPAYVEVGSHVTKGQTLCILEAMKLMNELESEMDGVVREILVANADPVEYGQVLFRIEPAGAAAA